MNHNIPEWEFRNGTWSLNTPTQCKGWIGVDLDENYNPVRFSPWHSEWDGTIPLKPCYTLEDAKLSLEKACGMFPMVEECDFEEIDPKIARQGWLEARKNADDIIVDPEKLKSFKSDDKLEQAAHLASCYLEAKNRHHDFPEPCISSFEQFAANDPERLIMWIESGELAPWQLTFAAEALGNARSVPTYVWENLLKHESTVVREGVIMGMMAVDTKWMRNCLKNRLEVETNVDLIEIIKEFLEY